MVKGPLGLWGFPILNAILELFQGNRRPVLSQKAEMKPVVKNLEVIEWSDWKGRSRTITVHREVEQSV